MGFGLEEIFYFLHGVPIVRWGEIISRYEKELGGMGRAVIPPGVKQRRNLRWVGKIPSPG
jgi:hypothetical protein